MSSFSALPFIHGSVPSSARQLSFPNFHSSAALMWGQQRQQDVRPFPGRVRGQKIRVLANPNASSGKEYSKKVVVMVDPLEAKRLAAKQMEQIKAKEKFKRRRQIEAINGAWAMIGLTAGLVIEGHTGNGIPAQLAGYWAAIIGFFGFFLSWALESPQKNYIFPFVQNNMVILIDLLNVSIVALHIS